MGCLGPSPAPRADNDPRNEETPMPRPTASPLSRRTLLAGVAAAAAITLATPGVVRAQAGGTWPSQPVRMILPYAPGGPTDVIARLICDTLSQRLPQRVVV